MRLMRRWQRRVALAPLLTDRPWGCFDATIVAGKSMTAVADGEAALRARCEATGEAMEFMGAISEGLVRVYRVDREALTEPPPATTVRHSATGEP